MAPVTTQSSLPTWEFIATTTDDWVSLASTSSNGSSPFSSSLDNNAASPGLNHYLSTTPTALSVLHSPNMQRCALYQGFIDNYLPRHTLSAIQEGHFTFFQTLAQQRFRNPALQSGFDALSLVQLGSTHHDEALRQQAQSQYALALRALGRSIAKKDFLYDDEVLAAVVVLSAAELYEGIQTEGNGWGNHIEGAARLVVARGPVSMQSDLAFLLYANMRHGAMCHALIERKAPFFARKEWREVAWRVPLRKDESNLFYEWGIQVPGLLERHDQLDMESETAMAEIDAILEESAVIERELKKWWEAWNTLGDFSFGGLKTLVPLAEFPTFISLCNDTTIDPVYRFPDFLIGYLQSVYWVTMHNLRTVIQSLHKKRHKLDLDWYPSPEEEVQEEELMEYILDLCRCFPFFAEPETNATGSIAIFLPMRAAAIYFTQQGHWRLLKWIGAVRNNVFVKGLKPPAVDAKLAMGGSPPKIASAGSSPG